MPSKTELTMEHSDVEAPVAKGAAAWMAVAFAKFGIHEWSDLAAMLASLYTLVLLGEWCWKKFGKDFAKRRGWVR